MKNIKKSLILLLAVAMVFSLVACTTGEEPEPEEAVEEIVDENVEEMGTRTITDHAGNEVELPDKIERVVIDQIPILSTYMAYHEGSAPYIVGYAGSLKSVVEDTVLRDIAPELLDAETTVHGQSDLNPEEIIKLDPDVIFYNAQNEEHYEVLKKTGIPCVGFATIGGYGEADPIDRYGQWLRLLEDVFGEPGKMDDFLAAGDEIVAEIEEKIAEIEDRPSSMILWKYADGVPIVAGNGTFGHFWLERLGVPNVAAEAKGYAQVNVEQLYTWDPEVFFLDGPGLLDISTYDVYDNNVEGIDFSSFTAVGNERVYNTKLGMWNWLTPNPDAPLVLGWLAQSAYPEEFADYDLDGLIEEYYNNWYNYDISDEQIQDMFDI